MSEVRLEGVGKVFPTGVRALRDVSLVVGASEWLVLVGPSGCGKTTLLRILAGLETATEGRVRLDGKDMGDVPPWRRRVALLPQQPALLPAESVRDNLSWNWRLEEREPGRSVRRLLRRSALAPAQEQALRRMAQLLGLGALLEQRADRLSGGEQQRVALGRALLREAGVRLLDEPLAHIDPVLRTQLRREMRLHSRAFPATMLYVTHDPADALAVGEKIAVLHRGALQQLASPHTIMGQPSNRVVAELFGQQQGGGLNLIEGSLVVEDGRRHFAGPWGLWPVPASWQTFDPPAPRVAIGIRGDDLSVGGHGSTGMTVLLTEFDAAGVMVVCGDERGRLTARLPAGSDVRVGQSVMVSVNLERGFCFDSVSGQSLRFPGG